MNKYRLWNDTLKKWVKDEDGNDCEFTKWSDARTALDRVRDVQQLNPQHKNDRIGIATIVLETAMNSKEVRKRLQGLAKHIASVVGKETAFALLVFADEPDGSQRCEYVSNGKREEVWKSIAEWVLKTSEKPLGDS